MNPEFYAPLGTAVSAFLAALGYLWKIKSEQRRTTRTVLYHLLEMHHRVTRSHLGVKHYPNEYVERIRASLRRKGFELAMSEVESYQLVIPELVRNLALTEMRALKVKMAEPFDRALTELAKDDPLLAFELRGKDDIISVEDILERASIGLPSEVEVTPELAAQTVKLRQSLDDFERTASIDGLERCIRTTASRCGVWTRFRVLRHLRTARKAESWDDVDTEFGKRAQVLIELITDEVVASQQPQAKS